MTTIKTGYVYAITNTVDNELYIGSTSKTPQIRFKGHINNRLNKKVCNKLYTKMRSLGVEFFNVIKLETIEYTDKKELFMSEQFYINILRPELNSIRAYVSNEELLEMNRKWDKRRYQRDKIKRLKWCTIYYQKNKDKIIKRVHDYASTHKQEIHDRAVKYRAKHKDKINAHKKRECICECGTHYQHDGKARHLRSQKHIKHANH